MLKLVSFHMQAHLNEKKKKDAKQDLLIIDAETSLLSHPSTLECVSPNSGIFFPNLFGASSERITLYVESNGNTYLKTATTLCWSSQYKNALRKGT